MKLSMYVFRKENELIEGSIKQDSNLSTAVSYMEALKSIKNSDIQEGAQELGERKWSKKKKAKIKKQGI